MCLAIPARIEAFDDARTSATADILGLRRQINVMLLADEPLDVGDWVLVHVGFAMSKISEQRAHEQIALLEKLGEAAEAHAEATGYLDADAGPPARFSPGGGGP